MAEPCGWQAFTGCCPEWATLPDEVKAEATATAEMILWALSGRQFSVCPRTIRPCAEPRQGSLWAEVNAAAMGGGAWMTPYVLGGAWFNTCGCAGGCGCGPSSQLVLPRPVNTVTQVKIDGVALAPADWALLSGALIRTDGGAWPVWQNMSLPGTEPGTFEITLTVGTPVPAGGNMAAGRLACELAKACQGKPCALPSRVTEISREGVTMTLLDPQDYLEDGLTGINTVDQWLAAVNPYKQRQPSMVWSPDVQQHKTYTPGS